MANSRPRTRAGVARVVALGAVLPVVLTAAACGGSSNGSTASGNSDGNSSSSGQHYKVALSLSYYGNDWQTEAANLVKAEAASPPYAGRVTLRQDIAGTSVPKQIQQINNEVAAGMNAIVLYPISPTALNNAIQNACNRGVVVVAYNAYVTAPCAYNVTTSDLEFGTVQAQWLADELHGKGDIVEMTGVAGTSADSKRREGWDNVLKKNPGIHVVAHGDGEWDPATTKTAFSGILAAHPNIDGVLAETSCQAVESVYQSQGKPLVPCSGESENAWRMMMLPKDQGGEGVSGVSVGGPAYTGELAFINAIAILDGAKMKHAMEVPLPKVTTENLKAGTDVSQGANVFPPSTGLKVSPGFFDDLWSPLVNQGVQAAIDGKPNVVSTAKACSDVPGCITGDDTSLYDTFAAGTVAE